MLLYNGSVYLNLWHQLPTVLPLCIPEGLRFNIDQEMVPWHFNNDLISPVRGITPIVQEKNLTNTQKLWEQSEFIRESLNFVPYSKNDFMTLLHMLSRDDVIASLTSKSFDWPKHLLIIKQPERSQKLSEDISQKSYHFILCPITMGRSQINGTHRLHKFLNFCSRSLCFGQWYIHTTLMFYFLCCCFDCTVGWGHVLVVPSIVSL